MKNVIEIEKLVKSYGKLRVLNELTLQVKKGEILGLLGPNGSGKTTTINCLLSLLKYDSGSISIFGQQMSPEAYDIKQKIGVVFQNVAVFEELSVVENIDYFCGLYVKDKEKRHTYVEEAILLVGLQDFKKFKPKQLSGGLLRRLNIACGIAHKPELIFFDEPTVAVDPQSRNNILEGIRRLNEMGSTIIYTSHYMEEVEQLCDRIIIIDKGSIIACGTKEELKELVDIEEKVTVELEKEPSKKQLDEISAMKNINAINIQNNTLYIEFSKGKHNLEKLLDYLKDEKITYNKIYSELPTLNDVFLSLTGKELRD